MVAKLIQAMVNFQEFIVCFSISQTFNKSTFAAAIQNYLSKKNFCQKFVLKLGRSLIKIAKIDPEIWLCWFLIISGLYFCAHPQFPFNLVVFSIDLIRL